MLFILRILIACIYCVLVCTFGIMYCLFSPRNPSHTAIFANLFSRMATLFGLKVEIRMSDKIAKHNNYIYIANHQNNYDMVTAAKIMQPRTLTVGKKSLLWIPFFGPLYWLSGNLIIDRDNPTKAHKIIFTAIKDYKKRNISILIFPEGTRSRGRGLMPFKISAFYAAITSKTPIIPICISTTSGKINLNRWNNGQVIVEMMPSIDTSIYGKESVRELANYCHALMKEKISQLDTEIIQHQTTTKQNSHSPI